MTAQFQFFQSLPHKKADFVKKKPAEHGYYLFAKYAFAAYDQNGIPYPDYGLDDEWAGEACPP